MTERRISCALRLYPSLYTKLECVPNPLQHFVGGSLTSSGALRQCLYTGPLVVIPLDQRTLLFRQLSEAALKLLQPHLELREQLLPALQSAYVSGKKNIVSR